MQQRLLATLTIGRAPRHDVIPIIGRHAPAPLRRPHRGVRDGLTQAGIEQSYGAEAGEAAPIIRPGAGRIDRERV